MPSRSFSSWLRVGCATLLGLGCASCAATTGEPLRLADGSVRRPFAALYSIFAEPLEDGPFVDVSLVVTFVDVAFRCDAPDAALDALSMHFHAPAPGVSSAAVLGLTGPRLAGATGGHGAATLRTVDDRYDGIDGGTVAVTAGGHVTGAVHYQFDGALSVDGDFDAPHCATLDFVASP